MKQKDKALAVLRRLKSKYPDADIELNFNSPLELLVATVLSAQCTDKRVNKVTEALFQKYRAPQDYLAVPEEDLQNDIRPTGFFRQKTESLRGIMTALVEEYGGSVPETMQELTQLPGIGRKTANVILSNAFSIPGIAVDTHVKRVSQRLGLTEEKNPDKIEKDLMKLFPEGEWSQVSHTFIFHGRYTCKARTPKCEDCPLTELCNYYRELQNQE